MARNFWRLVNEVLQKADILLLVLDARVIDETRHPELEKKIMQRGKHLIYVINKADLVSKGKLQEAKKTLSPCVFMSARHHHGTSVLRSAIMQASQGESVTVGVLGYPNTGKSSVINALSGGGAAKSAPIPGFTKALQLVRATSKIMMLDTPGVIPFQEKDERKHLIIGSKDPRKTECPEDAAEFLLSKYRSKVEKWYGLINLDPEEDVLPSLAKHLNFVLKGGSPDIRRAAVKVLLDWQQGKII